MLGPLTNALSLIELRKLLVVVKNNIKSGNLPNFFGPKCKKSDIIMPNILFTA